MNFNELKKANNHLFLALAQETIPEKQRRLTLIKNHLEESHRIIEEQLEKQTVFDFIQNELRALEHRTGLVTVLQFALHPSGNLSLIFRAHNANTGKEYTIPDVVLPNEILTNDMCKERMNVLFKTIHEALSSIQVIAKGKFNH